MPFDQFDPDIHRMVRLAEEYLADADLLAGSASRQSHGDYLLRLTAFEILLKALRRGYGVNAVRNHKYRCQFEGLPAEARAEIVRVAQARLGPAVDYSDVATFLDRLSTNFSDLRYSYEKSQGEPLEATRVRGQRWLDEGAEGARADFVLHPEELFGLTEALRQILSRNTPRREHDAPAT